MLSDVESNVKWVVNRSIQMSCRLRCSESSSELQLQAFTDITHKGFTITHKSAI